MFSFGRRRGGGGSFRPTDLIIDCLPLSDANDVINKAYLSLLPDLKETAFSKNAHSSSTHKCCSFEFCNMSFFSVDQSVLFVYSRFLSSLCSYNNRERDRDRERETEREAGSRQACRQTVNAIKPLGTNSFPCQTFHTAIIRFGSNPARTTHSSGNIMQVVVEDTWRAGQGEYRNAHYVATKQ